MQHAIKPAPSPTTALTATVLVASLLLLTIAMVGTAAAGQFVPTGSMTESRFDHSATLLDNGKVLIVGGYLSSPTSAELYDPATGVFSPTSGQPLYSQQAGSPGRFRHAAVKLQDGRVLIVGGGNLFWETLSDPRPFAEIYDPVSDSFTATGSMIQERQLTNDPVLLSDGRVLIAGGAGCCFIEDFGSGGIFRGATALGTMEIYDPITGAFATVQAESFPPLPARPVMLSAPRDAVTTIGLDDGRVLIAGGASYMRSPTPAGGSVYTHYPATADLYDPLLSPLTIEPTNSHMLAGRPWSAAALLNDGQVLFTLSSAYHPITNVNMPHAPAERFDPETGQFYPSATPPAGSADRPRNLNGSRIVVLDDGKVLFAGGLIEGEFYGGDPNDDLRADLYDPDTNAFITSAGTMIDLRNGHTATKLADGRVLFTGGTNFVQGVPNQLSSAELYDPDPIFASGFQGTKTRRIPVNPTRQLNLSSHPNLAVDDSGTVVYSTCPDAIKPMTLAGAFSRHVVTSTFIDPTTNRVCHAKMLHSP